MKCVRCNREMDTAIPELNADNYGGNIWACPNCGKAYRFYRTVIAEPIETDAKEDDWGKKIIQKSRKYEQAGI